MEKEVESILQHRDEMEVMRVLEGDGSWLNLGAPKIYTEGSG